MPAGAVVLLGVVLAVGAYIGWYRLSGNGELPPEVVPPVPARLAPLAERVVPPGNVTQSSSARLAASAPPAAGAAPPASGLPAASTSAAGASLASAGPALASAAPPAAAQVPPGAAATDIAAPAEPAVPPTQAAAATTMPPVAAAPAPPAAPQARIVLSATADAWMEVRDRSGQVLLNRVLHAGELVAGPGAARTCCSPSAMPGAPTSWSTGWRSRRWAPRARCGTTFRWMPTC